MSLKLDVKMLIDELEATAESLDLNEPSAILCSDPETATKTITGPYESGYAAFQAMEKLKVHGGWPPGVVFEIVPIYPPRGVWA